MSNQVIIHKKSAVAGKKPTTEQLQFGEFAINTYDGKLYTKIDDGVERVINITSKVVTVSENPPSNPEDGSLWFDTNDASLNVYYIDGTSEQWISVDPALNLDSSSLGELSDVDLSTAPTNGQVIKWNGSAFVPADDNAGTTINSIGDIGDVDLSIAPTNGQALLFNSTSNNFEPSDVLTDYTVTEADVTQHQSALSITESQISDLGAYLTSSDIADFATETYVDTAVANLVDAAPGTLDTLNELAAALGDDPNFATTVSNSIGLKANSADLATVATSGDYTDLINTPTIPTNVSELTNDSGYITTVAFADLTTTPTTLAGYGITDAATSAQGALADSAVQPSDNISVLTNDSGYITGYTVTESDVTTHQAALSVTKSQVSDLVTTDLDLGTNKILYSNVYSNLVDLPAAADYHGMFAHVHATGKAYYAHAGSWVELANESELFDGDYNSLTNTPTLFDGDYNSLTNTPTLFDGDYSSLANTPTIPTAITDLGISDGTSGQVLSTDGSGNFTFIDVVAGESGASVTAADTAPSSPSEGDLWYNTTTLDLYVYYSNNWVETSGDGGGSSLISTDDISEGSTNLYYTDTRVQTVIDNNTAGFITDYTVTEADVTQHQAALSITESQISDLQSYLTDYTVTETDVTTHQNALSITESQISDLQSYLTDYTVTEADVTTHQAALSITESQISDLQSYLTSETTTSLAINANVLTYTDETGTDTDIDLSLYLDDSNLARLVSGTVDASTGIATFTRDDATSFTVDYSAFLDDTNLARIDSASFNTTDGVLTLTRGADSSTITVDLDGRYALSNNSFSGSYNDLTDTPTIPSALTDLGITDGTNGQLLSTDGSGNFAFIDTPESGASVTNSDTAPSSPSDGDLWYNTSNSNLSIYYDDSSSQQWLTILSPDMFPDSALSNSTTDDLSEGSTNLYYTDTRVNNYLVANNYAQTSDVPTDISDLTDTSDLLSGATVTVSSTAPSSPAEGDLWFEDSTTGELYVYVNGAWLSTEDNDAPASVSATQPSNPNAGDLWYDSGTTGLLYVYDGSSWVQLITDSSISTTDDISEGSTNLYYTDARVQTVIDTNTAGFITSSNLSAYATETYVDSAVSNLVDSAPGTLDTLNELAAALGDDANFATTVTNNLATKVDDFTFTITNNASGAYVYSGLGTTSTDNPTLYLQRGMTYYFDINASGHPFRINTTNSTGSGSEYTTGVTNQGVEVGTLEFTVPQDAPRELYYNCEYHGAMAGTIYILDESFDYNDLTNKPSIPSSVSDLTNDTGFITDYTVTEADVTAHQAALSITESQISDLQSYLTDITTQSINNLSDVDITTTAPADGQALVWDSTNSQFIPGNVSSGTSSSSSAVISITVDHFTGDGALTDFTLSAVPSSIDDLIVTIDGVVQKPTDDFTLSAETISFVAAPPSGTTISSRLIGSGDGSSSTPSSNALPTWSEITTNETLAANSKYFVDCSAASITVTLPESPELGDEISIIDATGSASTNNIIINRNGNNIEAVATDLTIDVDRAAFSLVYYNATQGWLFTEK